MVPRTPAQLGEDGQATADLICKCPCPLGQLGASSFRGRRCTGQGLSPVDSSERAPSPNRPLHVHPCAGLLPDGYTSQGCLVTPTSILLISSLTFTFRIARTTPSNPLVPGYTLLLQHHRLTAPSSPRPLTKPGKTSWTLPSQCPPFPLTAQSLQSRCP